jgi:hypothetical protein
MQIGKRFPHEEVLTKMAGGEGGASLDYNKEDKTLTMYVTLPSPIEREVIAFRSGQIRFALYRNPILNTSIIMVYIGEELVFDLLFDINVLDVDMDGEVVGNRFDMFLIDSDTGILEGMRSIGLSGNFMKEINRITKNDGRYTTKQYNEWLNNDVFKKSVMRLWKESERINWDK